MNISHIDHIVLTVTSISESCEFYHNVLGMEILTFAEGRKALRFGNQKINLHQKGNEVEPKADLPTPGSADLCFIATDTIAEIKDHLEKVQCAIILGPVERTGAHGRIISVYFRDPDQNLIEISNYTD